MPTNEFLPFATGGGANVEPQATYAADTARTNGNQTGIASSALNNKALRQANFICSELAQYLSNTTGTDLLDDTNQAKLLSQVMAALMRLPPVITRYLSGSGTHKLTLVFFTASANATAGATYTNNSITYTVSATVSAGTQISMTGSGAPLVAGTLTKTGGSGDATITFYAVRAPSLVRVKGVGAGSGGFGSGTAAGTNPTVGGNTTFGTTLIVANGGAIGAWGNSATVAAGGTATLGTGPIGTAVQGAGGTGGVSNTGGSTGPAGSPGGNSAVGGGGYGGPSTTAGGPAASNSGSGGGSGGIGGAGSTGAGGAAGGFVDAAIPFGNVAFAYSYTYAVGAGGTGGGAGTGGTAGGAGADGFLEITESF